VWTFSDVSENAVASIIRVTHRHVSGESMFIVKALYNADVQIWVEDRKV
jgi:hypothetical protein